LAGRAPARARLATLLRAEGYEVIEVAEAAAARAVLARESVGMVLVDAALPDGGGLALVAEIRRQGLRLPVALFTNAMSVGTALAASSQGADAYLTLLLDDDDLRHALRQVLPHRPYRPQAATDLQTLGRLACGVVHDLNNLLTVVQGCSELLRLGAPPENPWRQQIEAIDRASARAAELTGQLLGFCKNRRVGRKVMDFNAVIAGLDPLLHSLLSDRVELSLALEPRAGAVCLEPGQLERVLLNLVLNARDAMPAGGHLSIETAGVYLDETSDWRLPVPPGPYVLLAVRDSGVGLDSEAQAHLFEPFFTTKEQRGGTGLGLAIVWEIVQAGGGTLRVESELGHGTTFRICFPQVPVSALATPAVAS
jgi:signal transduction histidine kinase